VRCQHFKDKIVEVDAARVAGLCALYSQSGSGLLDTFRNGHQTRFEIQIGSRQRK
jgi:hypothetical protein